MVLMPHPTPEGRGADTGRAGPGRRAHPRQGRLTNEELDSRAGAGLYGPTANGRGRRRVIDGRAAAAAGGARRPSRGAAGAAAAAAATSSGSRKLTGRSGSAAPGSLRRQWWKTSVHLQIVKGSQDLERSHKTPMERAHLRREPASVTWDAQHSWRSPVLELPLLRR
ncbi:uncharacterized protein LOC121333295 [Onychostruthus taczanowskii]|uniref:uncharacterized protein LOC121333295 n=1 Tax=Onychostruthus taczanowskii TaxID=356909 RepID=UPI001B80D3AD|nr:uncharacterized protein LOC121333295 [Onychostruthus taczanowskii]